MRLALLDVGSHKRQKLRTAANDSLTYQFTLRDWKGKCNDNNKYKLILRFPIWNRLVPPSKLRSKPRPHVYSSQEIAAREWTAFTALPE